MSQKLCAEYLRISPADAAKLKEISAPASTTDGGTAGLVGEDAKKLILEHFVQVPEDKALDIDTDWEAVLKALTGLPIDGQALGDPLAEAILGAERVSRTPLSAVIDIDRLKDVHTTLSGVDIDARIADNGCGDKDVETITRRYQELVDFYSKALEAKDAVLVAIS